MPEIEKAQAGSFCWVELNTTDPQAAKKFYSGLFGWSCDDMPMGDGTTYTLCKQGANHVGGVIRLTEEAKSMGAPPNWLSYVAVSNAAEMTQKATSLGGTVLVGPLDTPQGNFTVMQDPMGAVFALWESKQTMGKFLYQEHGSLGWNELITTDVDRAGKFYTALFGWKPKAQQMEGMVYTTFNLADDSMAGGMMPQPQEMAGAPSVWAVYFAVDDADAAAAKVASLGGKLLVPPTDIPTVGRFAVAMDPQGATFSVIKFLPLA